MYSIKQRNINKNNQYASTHFLLLVHLDKLVKHVLHVLRLIDVLNMLSILSSLAALSQRTVKCLVSAAHKWIK